MCDRCFRQIFRKNDLVPDFAAIHLAVTGKSELKDVWTEYGKYVQELIVAVRSD